jgi:predicted DNA-binding transcriptional regulator YafY
MPKENRQKMKMLKLIEMLQRDSDEKKPLRTSQIVKALDDMGISCDRRTLYKDIALLNEYGYDVQSRLIGHEKGYYISDRTFSVAELKILIDAVQASGFITPDKTKDLIDKIASLGGSSKAEILKTNLVYFNTAKHTNENIYSNVSGLENAIINKKKASFYYFDLNEEGKKVYRKNKKRYVVDPMELVFNDDNYYLVCYSSKYEGICNYRLDRMEAVRTEEEDTSYESDIDDSDLSEYIGQVFSMYGGPVTNVVLEFDDSLIGVVQDKFGEHALIQRKSDDTCIASVKLQTSPTFWGWLFQFVGQMRIKSPKSLTDEYRSRCKAVLEMDGNE